jgi:hypothetical protein
MRKFAANYLVSDTGLLLKNGIVLVGEDGFVNRFIDTKDAIRETEQLIFHNGILMAGFRFTKMNPSVVNLDNAQPIVKQIILSVSEASKFSIEQLVELGKQLQPQFPVMKIQAIFNEIQEILLELGFLKERIPGIYLLQGVDLAELQFTPRSWLRKIL